MYHERPEIFPPELRELDAQALLLSELGLFEIVVSDSQS
jgi:hypothetical protein